MRKLMALLVVLLFLLAACMGPAPIAQPSPNFGAEINLPQPEDVPSEENPIITPIVAGYGGHINVGMSLPRTLNPLLNSDPWVDTVLRLIFEPLVVFDADMRPIPNPAITQSITFSHDGRSLAVALRDNIFWEDGTAITARDIAFTIDVLQNSAPQTAVYKQNVANIVSHSVIDNRTLQITLRNPSWATKYMLAFPIISAEYYRPVSMANLAAARNMHPMGNGSFRFHSLEPADRLELIANHDAPGGRPYIDRITAIILRDMDGGQIHAFEQGIIDVLMTSPTDWGRYAARGKNRVGEISGGSFSFFGFNFNRTIFADHSLRSAIAHAFDLDTVLRRYYDHIDAAIAPINPNSWLAADGLTGYYFDTGRAENLLSQLGFVRGVDGILERRLSETLPALRLSMSILVNESNESGMGTANILKDGLLAVGIDANLAAVPRDVFQARVEAGDFDIVVGVISLGSGPNMGFLRSNDAQNNIFGYRSEDLALLISMLERAASESALGQAAVDIQHYIADNLPIHGIAFCRQTLYVSGHIHTDTNTSISGMFSNIRDWFVVN